MRGKCESRTAKLPRRGLKRAMSDEQLERRLEPGGQTEPLAVTWVAKTINVHTQSNLCHNG